MSRPSSRKNSAIVPAARNDRRSLRLPQPQAVLDKTFDDCNFSLARCAQLMANIAENGENDADRLRAIDMRVRMTIGYAPTKSANVQMHGRIDQFYDKEEFDTDPGITLDGEGHDVARRDPH